MQFLWKYVDDMVGKGLEWYVILQLLFFASASFVPLALPLSVLLSSIMSFGKLAENYELMALKTAGISLVRVMVPMMTVVLLICGVAFYFANNVIPRANLKFKALLYDIRQQRPALDIKEGVFYGGIDNYVIRIGKKDKNSQKLEDLLIYDHTNSNGNNIVMTAKSGDMTVTKDKKWLIVNLYNGHRYEEIDSKRPDKPTFPASRLSYKSYKMVLDLSGFKFSRTKEDLFKDNYDMLNVAQLQFYIDSLKEGLWQKQKEVKTFTQPYFQFYRDTSYYYKATVTAPALAEKKSFIQSFPKQEQKLLLGRAHSSASVVKELFRMQAESMTNYRKTIAAYGIEWHRKFTLSLACLTLFFIGAPLGAIIRKGGIGMPTVAAIVMFVVFYVVMIVGEKSAKEEALSVVVGMWLPIMALTPVGFFLTYKANRDTITKAFVLKMLKIFSLFGGMRIRMEAAPTLNKELEEDENPPTL